MTNIHFDINNELTKENAEEVDVICAEHSDNQAEILCRSLVTVTIDNWAIKLRFDWKEKNNELSVNNFVYIPETNILFFKSQNQWGAIDLASKKVKRHEKATWTPTIRRKENYVLIEDELKAEATRLNADTIHSVPIDPPTESVEYGDKIEYVSPVFGHQVLRTKAE